MPVERSVYHDRSRRAGQAPLSTRVREIAETRVCYGYGRIHVVLRRCGYAGPINSDAGGLADLYSLQAMAVRVIAAEFDVSPATVSRILRQLGMSRLKDLEPSEPVRR